MKTSFKVIKNIILGFALLAFFLTANQVYALGSTPVKVVNPEEIAKAQGIQHPFQTTIVCSPTTGNNSTACRGGYIVPENQRLVIEFVSFVINLTQGIPLSSTLISTEVEGHNIPYTMLGYTANPVFGGLVGSQMTRIYADPGTRVEVLAFSQQGVQLTGSYSISGQLIDVP